MTKTKPQVYLGATLGTRGARLLNEQYQAIISEAGLTPYLAQNNKDINDKKNVKQEGLAKRIVEADFNAIDNSDMYLFDILGTEGTTCEVAGIYAQKRLATQLLNFMDTSEGAEEFTIQNMQLWLQEIVDKPVVATCTDLRSENLREQSGFSREWGINQMLRGIVDEVTNGVGFTPFEEVSQELKKRSKEV